MANRIILPGSGTAMRHYAMARRCRAAEANARPPKARDARTSDDGSGTDCALKLSKVVSAPVLSPPINPVVSTPAKPDWYVVLVRLTVASGSTKSPSAEDLSGQLGADAGEHQAVADRWIEGAQSA